VGNSIIIADLQSHSLGGHFRIWLNRTLQEAVKSFDQVSVYVADEISVPDLSLFARSNQKRIVIHQIPAIYNSRRFIGDILGVIADHNAGESHSSASAPIFLMWAQQYIERDLIFPPLKSRMPWKRKSFFHRPWASLTSVSSVAHGAGDIPDMEQRIHKEVHREPYCDTIFLWDKFAVDKLGGKYRYLPNVAHTEADPAWEMIHGGPLTVGSVGELWGYRSINLLADILAEEADVRGYAAGAQKMDSYSSDALKLFNAKNDSFTLEEGFIRDSSILNSKIRKLDAFVLGRPLVTVDSPSWVASLIREEGVGVFWKRGKGCLAADLRSWNEGGGIERAIQTAHRLSDQAGLEAAYTEMFHRLKSAP
jgi:hypothetical protein